MTVSMDFDKKFGGNTAGKRAAQRYEFWINVGYDSGVINEGETESRFISLPLGIALDNQERLPENSKNDSFRKFNVARNELLDYFEEKCKLLKPGERVIIGNSGGLQVELRRRNSEVYEESGAPNPYAKKLTF